MGIDAAKLVFGASDKAGLKPVSSAAETSWKLGFSFVATIRKANTKGADYSSITLTYLAYE